MRGLWPQPDTLCPLAYDFFRFLKRPQVRQGSGKVFNAVRVGEFLEAVTRGRQGIQTGRQSQGLHEAASHLRAVQARHNIRVRNHAHREPRPQWQREKQHAEAQPPKAPHPHCAAPVSGLSQLLLLLSVP